MNKIPSLINNIVFVGNVNSGKSSLINAITNQEVSIVSDIEGTTTDEIVKRFELLDIGPINLIDTAGLNDKSILGIKRIEKTNKVINRASLIINVIDATSSTFDFYKSNSKTLIVFNKIDLVDNEKLKELQELYPNALFSSVNDYTTINSILLKLKQMLIYKEQNLLDNIKFNHNKIIHIIPIDSAAPKGRIILPQMQLIRECLDLHLVSIILQPDELANYLDNNSDIDLIVCDSQVFKNISTINKKRYPLTSYSILQANQKGDLNYMIDNLKYIKQLKNNSRILLMESCSHNVSHEDIGNVKIPMMLKDILEIDFTYDFMMGYDYPENLSNYDYIIHCGSCMLHSDVMSNRINKAKQFNIPLTNYGLFIAYYNGIIEEATNIFNVANK